MTLSRKAQGAALIIAVGTALAAVLLFFPPRLFRELELRTWDWRARLTADRDRADRNIKIIAVDQPSLDFFEREYALTWPLPRDAYKHVIDFLIASGARGLAIDLLFTESSSQSVEGDKVLAEASSGPLPVVNAVNLETYEKFVNEEKWKVFAASATEQAASRNFDERFGASLFPEFRSITLPIMEILERGVALGSVHAVPNSDGVFREYQAGGRFRGTPVLSLPFALFERTVSDARLARPSAQSIVRLHGRGSVYETIPIAEVIQAQADLNDGKPPRLSLEKLRGSYVFLGATAPGLLDLRPTSVEERGNGVSFLAAVLDNLLHNDFVRRVPPVFELLVAIALLSATAAVVFRLENLRHQVLAAVVLLAGVLGIAIVAAYQGWWLSVVPLVLSLTLVAFLSLGLQYQLEGRQHRFIRRAFQFYVSPALVDQIVENPTTLAVGGEKRELSIFFSDLVGFTSLSERLDPTLLVSLLNDYLSLTSEIIQESGGTVDKYVGDAVVAFWNAPIPVSDHAERAVRTAIRCQAEILRRAAYFRETFGAELRARIGINSAIVSVGNFGSRTRFTYTMIGDGANLASRIEGINRYFGTSVLFTGSTESGLSSEIERRKVADLRVKGKAEVVSVFEPRTSDDDAAFTPVNLATYRDALAVFESGNLAESKRLFSLLPHDPVSQAYLRRIEGHLRLNAKQYSPVWEFSEK